MDAGDNLKKRGGRKAKMDGKRYVIASYLLRTIIQGTRRNMQMLTHCMCVETSKPFLSN